MGRTSGTKESENYIDFDFFRFEINFPPFPLPLALSLPLYLPLPFPLSSYFFALRFDLNVAKGSFHFRPNGVLWVNGT